MSTFNDINTQWIIEYVSGILNSLEVQARKVDIQNIPISVLIKLMLMIIVIGELLSTALKIIRTITFITRNVLLMTIIGLILFKVVELFLKKEEKIFEAEHTMEDMFEDFVNE
mmetsp:Transcript_19844/g.24485  ORF Transcript_19844/g.24485 Transcript_19844/m.24485 type:complete len:113 (-) Transcript_19844:256-594(-)